jgi:hypothetical protein
MISAVGLEGRAAIAASLSRRCCRYRCCAAARSRATVGCCGSRACGFSKGPSHRSIVFGSFQLIRGTPDRCSAIKQVRGVLASHQNLTPAANSSSRTYRCTLLATPRRLFSSMKTFAPPQMMSQSGKPAPVPRCFASNPEIAFRGVFSNAVANTPAARWRLNSSATRVRARHSSWRETLRRTTAKVSAATFAGA